MTGITVKTNVIKSMINLDLDPSQIEIYSIKKDKRKEFEKISARVQTIISRLNLA